jgi:Ca-activated chloride channel homolog
LVAFGNARRPAWILVGAVLAMGASVGAAERPRFASGTDLVVLSATAVDRHGRPVTNLRPDEFRVFEDGRPQKVEHFEARGVPARLLLLVDASGSMNGALKTASTQMAVRQVVAGLEPADEVALAGFDQEYWGIVPFTHEHDRVVDALSGLESFGSTALHDALDHAARDLASWGQGRRAVLVVTDGVDTASQLRPDDVLARSRALDVPIYAISVVSAVDDPSSRFFAGAQHPAAAADGAVLLQRYALLSGGAAFTVSDLGGLEHAAATILGELKHQYRLGYDPPAGPSRFRRVEITSTRKGVLVKTRSGYVPRT